MKKIKLITVVSAAVLAVALLSITQFTTGCLTSKTSTVTTNATGGFMTNVVTTVNTNNLILDASVFQAATAISVSLAIQKDPSVIPALKTTQAALDGVLNGTSTNTVQQVLSTLKATGNPALVAEITSLMATATVLEQNLLAKYGVSVAGQVGTALVRAADAGLLIGLAGH